MTTEVSHNTPEFDSQALYLLNNAGKKFRGAGSIDQAVVKSDTQIRFPVLRRAGRCTQENDRDRRSDQDRNAVCHLQPGDVVDMERNPVADLILAIQRPPDAVLG